MSMNRDAYRIILCAKVLRDLAVGAPILVDAARADRTRKAKEALDDAIFVFEQTYYPEDEGHCDYCGTEGHEDWDCPEMPVYLCPTHGEVAAEQTYRDPHGNRVHRCGVPVTDPPILPCGHTDACREEDLSGTWCSACAEAIARANGGWCVLTDEEAAALRLAGEDV